MCVSFRGLLHGGELFPNFPSSPLPWVTQTEIKIKEIKKKLFIFFLAVTSPYCLLGFPLVAESGGHSSCRVGVSLLASRRAACGLGHASLCLAACGLGSCRLQGMGPVGAAQGLRYSWAHGILPHQGLKPRVLHWQVDSFLLSHQGSP